MSTTVSMPQLGESVTEGTVTRWLKSVGDAVALDEPLLEISTDKVDTEIPSPAAGVLLAITVGEDGVAQVGGQLGLIGSPSAAPAPVAAAPVAPAPPAPAAQSGAAASASQSTAPTRPAAPQPAPPATAALPPDALPKIEGMRQDEIVARLGAPAPARLAGWNAALPRSPPPCDARLRTRHRDD